jgi:hypothetical protein
MKTTQKRFVGMKIIIQHNELTMNNVLKSSLNNNNGKNINIIEYMYTEYFHIFTL